MPWVGGGLSLRAGKPDLASPWKKRLRDPKRNAARRTLYPPLEVSGFSAVGQWALKHSCGPPPKGKDTLSCAGHRAQGLQVHVPTLGGETGRGPGPPPASPQRRVQTKPHLARSMTSPGGARELPARQQWPLRSKSAARPLLFSFLGWGPWSCWAKSGYEQPPLATQSSFWASVAPCARAGPKVAPLLPVWTLSQSGLELLRVYPRAPGLGTHQAKQRCVPSLPSSQAMLEEGKIREAQRPRMELAQE